MLRANNFILILIYVILIFHLMTSSVEIIYTNNRRCSIGKTNLNKITTQYTKTI